MTTFQEKMKAIASNLTPEAREVVKVILDAEVKMRYQDRRDLPNEFALAALKAAKSMEGNE